MVLSDISQKISKWFFNSMIKNIFLDVYGSIGVFLIVGVLVLAIFAPQIAPFKPNAFDAQNRLSPPTMKHPLGTDHYGRDTLSRLIFGARIALLVALPTVGFALIIGVIFGSLAGYSSGNIDSVMIYLFDLIRSFPAIILAMTVLALTQGSHILLTLILVIGLTRIPGYGRLVRSQAEKVRQEEYILAARSSGCSLPYIIFKHVLPNSIGPVFIQAAMDIPIVITYEAAFSFLGVGLPPPTPSWGLTLKIGYSYLRTAPWLMIFPAITLVLATLGFTFLGEAFRDVLDPKMRETAKL